MEPWDRKRWKEQGTVASKGFASETSVSVQVGDARGPARTGVLRSITTGGSWLLAEFGAVARSHTDRCTQTSVG